MYLHILVAFLLCQVFLSASIVSAHNNTSRSLGNSRIQTSVTYSNLRSVGTYDDVSYMNPGIFGQACPANACVKTPKHVDASMGPFNEEMSLVMRGPMEVYNIAVYEPTNGVFHRVSEFVRGQRKHNMHFMNNKGGNGSGVWTQCGGNSQSFASADGSEAASSSQFFSGSLKDDIEVNIMTEYKCNGWCGFHRGDDSSFFGWRGPEDGSKIFVIKAKMDHHHGARNEAAIWLLNSKILRTAQYGCNCRGVGPQGGCGEIDVAEVLKENPFKLTSTLYSFKGSVGAGEYANRPSDAPVTFAVFFDSMGSRVKILMMDEDGFDFGSVVSQDTLGEWVRFNSGIERNL